MIFEILQYLGAISGVFFLILEIRQNSFMWPLNILTAFCLGIVYFQESLWATFAMQVYYIVMSVVGIVNWRRIKQTGGEDDGKSIVTVPLRTRTVYVSAAAAVIGSAALWLLLRNLNDPQPLIDGVNLMLCIIATIWLTRCHREQWLIWILANTISLILTLCQHLWAPSLMYTFYIVGSIYGYTYWGKKSDNTAS